MGGINQYWVYMMSNESNSVLYVGVTFDIDRRVAQHKDGGVEGFTKRYKCGKLVYFELHNDINEAIGREKQLKNWKREWKNQLIDNINPLWRDLYKNDLEI